MVPRKKGKTIHLLIFAYCISIYLFYIFRKSRAKQGRPVGSTSGAAGPSTPKRQKVVRSDSTCTSPGPITRRQMALINAGEQGSSQMATPLRPPRAAKKITPKKGKK
jgi:hypothetical protein